MRSMTDGNGALQGAKGQSKPNCAFLFLFGAFLMPEGFEERINDE